MINPDKIAELRRIVNKDAINAADIQVMAKALPALLDAAAEAAQICDEMGMPEFSLGEAWRDAQRLVSLLRRQADDAAEYELACDVLDRLDDIDRLRAALADERKANRINAKKAELVNRLPFCADHVDKVAGKERRECAVESLTRRAERAEAACIDVFRQGYETGHEETVEACYALDTKERARDWAKDSLSDAGRTYAERCERYREALERIAEEREDWAPDIAREALQETDDGRE